MFKIKENTSQKVDTISMQDLKPCELARVYEPGSSHHGGIVMRTASEDCPEVMFLTNPGPSECWTDFIPDIPVVLLEPGTSITLTVV